ncbi:MAG: hypothetical protein DA329_10745 [Candidatus Nitrosocosmicus sp.]|nr:hypothetical protein [Candidatus Nitrosocosmicus sp.]
MNLKAKNLMITDLYFNKGKTYREIAKLTHTSPKQIKQILDKEKTRRLHDEIIEMILQGISIKEISIELDLTPELIDKTYHQYLAYKDKDALIDFCSDIKDSHGFLKFCSELYKKGLPISEIDNIRQFCYDIDGNKKNLNDQINIINDQRNTIQNQEFAIHQNRQIIFSQEKTKKENIKEIDDTQRVKKDLQEENKRLGAHLYRIFTLVNHYVQDPEIAEFVTKFTKESSENDLINIFSKDLIETIFNKITPLSLYPKNTQYINTWSTYVTSLESLRQQDPQLFSHILTTIKNKLHFFILEHNLYSSNSTS